MSKLIYAHAFPSTGDPHELVVDFDLGELERWDFSREWVEVTDTTGKRYELRSYPCGAGCHCAAQLHSLDE